MQRVLLLVLLIFGGFDLARAQDAERVAAIETAWRAWLEGTRITRSTLAIAYRGEILHEVGQGEEPDAAIPLASLSKAITGACIAGLVRQGRLTLETGLAEVEGLAPLLAGHPDPGEITIAQLLTHTSGLMPDATQYDMFNWLEAEGTRHDEAAAKALARDYGPDAAGKYLYNNENYALLGTIIESVAGQDYYTFCGAEVLTPAGAQGGPSPVWGALGAWGGWQMSAADYLKFVWSAFGTGTAIGTDPLDWPHVDLGAGVYYGMGTLFRSGAAGNNFWHFGAHCFGPRGEAGTFFAQWRGEWAVMVSYNDCISDRQMGKLDSAMARAALQ